MWNNIGLMLVDLYDKMGMDTPCNHYEIVDYVHRRVFETCFPESYDKQDVLQAFSEWISRTDLKAKKRKWLGIF
jgi:hypothetical protein